MEFINEVLLPSSAVKEPNFYEILGCHQSSNMGQILTEYKIKALQFHPDKNLDDPNSTNEFMKLQIAKEVLCDAQSRRDYDTWLNSGLKISFEKWRSMSDSLKASMHWATPKKEELMIEHKIASCSGSSLNVSTSTDGIGNGFSETLQKFRNYEI